MIIAFVRYVLPPLPTEPPRLYSPINTLLCHLSNFFSSISFWLNFGRQSVQRMQINISPVQSAQVGGEMALKRWLYRGLSKGGSC